jgi:uncharacterized protein (TIGR03067 family)
MRTITSLLILALTASAAEPDKIRAALQGEWRIVSVEGDGPAKMLKDNVERITIDGEKITAGRPADYALDAAKSTIDMTITGGPKGEQGKYLGVFELKGNELKLHFALPGKERPSGFAKKDGTFVISLQKK